MLLNKNAKQELSYKTYSKASMILVLLSTLFYLNLIGISVAQTTILNVSYDPTRELYREFNAAFSKYWNQKNGETITIRMSHGGSGAQARAVIDGLNADVVTLALQSDIDAIAAHSKKIRPDWRETLPNNSVPFSSTIVFLVRKDNPKAIYDWDDLIRDDVKVITPNPKTSGGARWNFLAAWGFARDNFGGDEAAESYVSELFRRVPLLDTGARNATTSFAQRGIGDVLIAWENEAFLAIEELGKDKFEIIMPSLSIKAEPPVALVDANVDRNKTRQVATEYLEYLYSDIGQKIAARHYYRPAHPEVVDAAELQKFKDTKLLTIDDFGGWKEAQTRFFDGGGIFDQIFKPRH